MLVEAHDADQLVEQLVVRPVDRLDADQLNVARIADQLNEDRLVVEDQGDIT